MISLNNLFSMFDPSTQFAKMSWSIMIFPMMMMWLNFSMKKSKKNITMEILLNLLTKEFNQSMKNKMHFSTNILKYSFLLIFLMNFLSLIQYNFTPSAHLSISFFIALSFWMSIQMNMLKNNFKKSMAHMTPMATPNPLMNFMVLIELVSNIIRPITLSVRLSANMIAGHLLISLLSSFSMLTSKLINLTMMMMLLVLEMSVSFIQAYVLTTLMCLYYNESMN